MTESSSVLIPQSSGAGGWGLGPPFAIRRPPNPGPRGWRTAEGGWRGREMTVDWEFVARWISIVVLDLTLAGDNAVVIALAVRTLPRRQQRLGIFWGAMAAVVLRVAVTFVAAQLLRVPLLQFGGGGLLLWIAWKLLRQEEAAGETG